MSATSLATKGVICRRTIGGGIVVGGGGPPMGKDEEFIKPKIKVIALNLSGDKKGLSESTFKVTGLKLILD